MAETLKLGNGIWATKENSLLSYNDENGNYKPLPFDFTRASSATVVNKAGLIETVQSGTPRIDFLGNTNGALKLEPQRTNLITQSEAFGNSYWTKTGASIGGSVTSAESGTDYASGWDFTDVGWLIGGTATKDNSTTITLPTGGYVRNKFSGVTAKTVLIRLKGSFSGAGSGFSVADYDTNNIKTITDSTFDEYIWLNSVASQEPISFKYYDGSVTVIFSDIEIYELADGFTSPSADSPLNAFKLVEDTSTGRHETQAPSSSSGDLAFSFFAKKGENSFIQITNSQDPSAYANFDLNLGVLGSSNIFTPTIIDYGNGWYRCIATINAPLSINYARIGLITSSTSARVESYTGDGTSGVYIYGAQLEESSYPTSYIPTQGSTVTRVAETCTGAGNDQVINSTEGVLYLEISALDISGDYRLITLSDGTTNNRTLIGFRLNTGYIYYYVIAGGVTQSNFDTTITSVNSFSKIALKYKVNDFALWVNGVEIYADSSGSVVSGLDTLQFADGNGTSRPFYGKTKDLRVYNTALTDGELATLTSL